MCHQSERGDKTRTKMAFQSQTLVQPYDPTTYFFHKFGSSFNQLQAPLTRSLSSTDKKGLICFKETTIRNVFQIILKLLAKDLLDYLDNLADDIFVSQTIKVFPYKSFSETLSLVMISLLREMLNNQEELAQCVVRDVQDYIKQVFTSGSLDLGSRHQEAVYKEQGEKPTVNKFKLNVQTNAACVDILVWAAREESGK